MDDLRPGILLNVMSGKKPDSICVVNELFEDDSRSSKQLVTSPDRFILPAEYSTCFINSHFRFERLRHYRLMVSYAARQKQKETADKTGKRK